MASIWALRVDIFSCCLLGYLCGGVRLPRLSITPLDAICALYALIFTPCLPFSPLQPESPRSAPLLIRISLLCVHKRTIQLLDYHLLEVGSPLSSSAIVCFISISAQRRSPWPAGPRSPQSYRRLPCGLVLLSASSLFSFGSTWCGWLGPAARAHTCCGLSSAPAQSVARQSARG